jgi:hypothetical protein
VQLADFEPLRNRDGPISVVDNNGNAITHAPSGAARAVDPNAQPQTLQEIQIVLFDEMTRPTRAIRGDQIEEIIRSSPGWALVVGDTVEPDEGTSIRTRGA